MMCGERGNSEKLWVPDGKKNKTKQKQKWRAPLLGLAKSIYYRTSKENLSEYQDISSLVIVFFVLITWMFELVVMA